MRATGVLLHISSLPGPYGIGSMGANARKFADFLDKAGVKYWQILPICPTSYGDSPYQSFSSFAGNPYFIDLDELISDGLLTKKECDSYEWFYDKHYVEYGTLYINRYKLFRKAYKRFAKKKPADFDTFVKENADWLPDFALFMALKDAHGGDSWVTWEEEELKAREPKALETAKEKYADDVEFYEMLQYLFFKQWRALKEYVNAKGIEIIGDTPIYVAQDSADVWASPEQFYLDEKLDPIDVAGCPPDCFTEDGQLWGNPLYRWDAMEADGFKWWIRRVDAMSKVYDIIRIDHFRGFAGYYAIPYGMKNARIGEWRKGPGIKLFDAIKAALGDLPIIAEDLGFLTDDVTELIEATGFPGMKILEFGFDTRTESDYTPYQFPRNCVVYTGTHDNEPLMTWFDIASKESVDYAVEYLQLNFREGYNWGMIRGAMESVADYAIFPMQDILGLGMESRMNAPSTIGNNWKWRVDEKALTTDLAKRLHHYNWMYGRLKPESKNKPKKK